MKFILFIIITMSNQNTGSTPVAVDHMTFNTAKACNEMKEQVTKPMVEKSGGLMGAVNAINGAINSPIIKADCKSVDDSAAAE
jgi:hypothetical protein